MDPIIETVTGKLFDARNPKFYIQDIAESLQKLCRFNGHTSQFYSVAAHSVFVSELMCYYGLGDPMEGLLHDAVEAYLGDIPTPIKTLLPDYKRLESSLESLMREQFHLPSRKTKGCHRADSMALKMEAKVLQHSKGLYIQYSGEEPPDFCAVRWDPLSYMGDGLFLKYFHTHAVERYNPKEDQEEDNDDAQLLLF